MPSHVYGDAPSPPPSVEEARNRRQRVRACGMDPDYWYAVEQSKDLAVGEVKAVVFWKRSFAIFRGADGAVRAVEDRCAHRQLKLSAGAVKGCQLQCIYHGWSYDGDGRLVDIPHHTFGKGQLKLGVQSFPVQERYGLIWLFPGDPERVDEHPIPDIAELEGRNAWAMVPLDFVWQGHHSMIMDNVSDLTHGFLHRKYEPFEADWKLTHLERRGDAVHLTHDYRMASGPLIRHFVKRTATGRNTMHACYQYPYHWSNTDDYVRHWLFVLPIDERKTRCFFLFHYDGMRVPGLGWTIPNRFLEPVLKLANRHIIGPLLQQDGDAVKLEQDGYDAHWDKPIAEVSPLVKQFQDLTIEKWDAYLERARAHESAQPGRRSPALRSLPPEQDARP